jgi:GH15 family glucan-1,4-alpha-glucosidase
MAWVAVDRAVKAVEQFGLEGPVDRWRRLRSQIHQEVCSKGYDAERGAFVQYYGAKALDASVLMVPMVGFLPASDPRVRSTVEAIERELMVDGFVLRYATTSDAVDGLPPGEGVFLPCSYWMANNLAMLGRTADAEVLFERLLDLCNDVGLVSEEYDPKSGRLLGNFPQAFTHVALITTAALLSKGHDSSGLRGAKKDEPNQEI